MSNVKKAEGKLGVLVVGLGAVSSTFITGVDDPQRTCEACWLHDPV